MKTNIIVCYQVVKGPSLRQTIPLYRLALPVLIILTAFFLADRGAVTQNIHLPPVSETSSGKIQDGRFVWLDLMTENTIYFISTENPLPSGPEHMPDRGAPDFGGDFGGDLGGDW